MTYNVLDGGVGRENQLVEVLQAVQPDLVLLQEVFDTGLVERLAGLFGMEWFIARANTRWHLALLSRCPIIARESYRPLPPILQTVLDATVRLPSGEPLRIIGMNTAPLPSFVAELWRRWEVGVMLARYRTGPDLPCLVMGDFNAIAPGDRPAMSSMRWLDRVLLLAQANRIVRLAVPAILESGLADCYRALHPGDGGFTVPAPAPCVRLDYIFANPRARAALTGCFVVREPAAVQHASDHYPVVADFDM